MVPAGIAPLKSMERHQFPPPACDSLPGEIKWLIYIFQSWSVQLTWQGQMLVFKSEDILGYYILDVIESVSFLSITQYDFEPSSYLSFFESSPIM